MYLFLHHHHPKWQRQKRNCDKTVGVVMLKFLRSLEKKWEAEMHLKCGLTLPHSYFWGDWLSFYVVACTFGAILNAFGYPAWSPVATLERHGFPTGPEVYLRAQCKCNHSLHPEDTDFRWAHLKFSLKCLPLRLKPLQLQCLHTIQYNSGKLYFAVLTAGDYSNWLQHNPESILFLQPFFKRVTCEQHMPSSLQEILFSWVFRFKFAVSSVALQT